MFRNWPWSHKPTKRSLILFPLFQRRTWSFHNFLILQNFIQLNTRSFVCKKVWGSFQNLTYCRFLSAWTTAVQYFIRNWCRLFFQTCIEFISKPVLDGSFSMSSSSYPGHFHKFYVLLGYFAVVFLKFSNARGYGDTYVNDSQHISQKMCSS